MGERERKMYTYEGYIAWFRCLKRMDGRERERDTCVGYMYTYVGYI